jgi:regulator of sigma E protease
MLGSILIFLVVLSILVLAHEAGHFIAAKKAGVKVEEFGFGIPPRLFGIKIGKTLYSLNLLPFGGFVKLYGENDEESIGDSKQAFLNKNKRTRISILLSGVIMNFILAIVAFAVVYSFAGIPKETKNVKILEIASGSPAQVGGLLVGDIVRVVDKEKVDSMDKFIDLVEGKKGKKVVLEIERVRGEEKVNKKFTLYSRENPPQGEGPLGVTISSTEIYYPFIVVRPFVGIYYGFKEAVFWGKMVIDGFIKIFRELFGGHVPQDLSGPVGIFAITSQVSKIGILALINFIGILSVNLAILNVLPFPALDGGRLLFIGLESIFGRKILPKVESAIHTVGMVILLMLLLAITARDIQRLVVAGSIARFIESVLK